MPQPKSKTPPRRRTTDSDLKRLLNPVDAVVLTRERLQEVVDDAVKRGRMTRTDATELVAEIFARSRSTTEEILGLLPTDRVRREVDKARRATGLGPSFPISGYEGLTAAQVQARLDDLSPAELRKVRDYERRNANRKTVLSAIETKLG
jgi:hypothetical protein